mmetsp:Transcript_1023/g.2855  ORF Transcript_1023/g.2855 Transcript_1023/m.2855 type:complete len:229 (-) Transcript_1023:1557-2243(-)
MGSEKEQMFSSRASLMVCRKQKVGSSLVAVASVTIIHLCLRRRRPTKPKHSMRPPSLKYSESGTRSLLKWCCNAKWIFSTIGDLWRQLRTGKWVRKANVSRIPAAIPASSIIDLDSHVRFHSNFQPSMQTVMKMWNAPTSAVKPSPRILRHMPFTQSFAWPSCTLIQFPICKLNKLMMNRTQTLSWVMSTAASRAAPDMLIAFDISTRVLHQPVRGPPEKNGVKTKSS